MIDQMLAILASEYEAIVVESSRYGGKKSAGFDTWIDSADPVTRELG